MLDWNNTLVLINKPLHWTSFDVVKKAKGLLKVKKIGHAGTLDPLAEGLLILATGSETKNITLIQELEKTYEATFCLGATTVSLDREFFPTDFHETRGITQELIEQTIRKHFMGDIQQSPPNYSAVKINGTRAYKLARLQKVFETTPKTVSIYKFEISSVRIITPKNLPEYTEDSIQVEDSDTELLLFEAIIVCSKGTYIRTLAGDLGRILGVSGYLTALRRTAIGGYQLSDAYEIQSLASEQTD